MDKRVYLKKALGIDESAGYHYWHAPAKVWEAEKQKQKNNPNREAGKPKPNPAYMGAKEISEEEYLQAFGYQPKGAKKKQAE
jgi:hypothetical protein